MCAIRRPTSDRTMDMKKPLPSYCSNVRQELLVIGSFLVVLLLYRFEAILNINSSYLGGFSGDGGLYVWLTKSNARDLFSLPWFNTKSFFPYTRTLAWSDNFILPSTITNCLHFLGLSFIAGYNCTLLLATLLNGYFTYLLAFRLNGKLLYSFVSGFFMLTLPTFTFNLGHPQLQFFFPVPLGIYFLFNFLETRKAIHAVSVGLTIVALFLSCVYYAVFLALALAVLLVVLLIIRRELLPLSILLKFLFAAAAGLIALLPFLAPYLAVQDVFGKRGLYEPYYFSATGLSYLSSVPGNLLYSFTSSFSAAEAHLFPGIIGFLLLLIAFIRISWAKQLRKYGVLVAMLLIISAVLSTFVRREQMAGYLCATVLWTIVVFLLLQIKKLRHLEDSLDVKIVTNRDLIALFLSCAVVFYSLSFGPLGNPEKGHLALGPAAALYYTFPGVSALRAISRSGIMVLFFISLLVPFSLSLIEKSTGFGKSGILTILILIGLESYTDSYPLQVPPKSPKVLSNLAQRVKKEDVVVFLPFTSTIKQNRTVSSWSDFAKRNVSYMNWAQEINVSSINGYSGQRSKIMREFPGKMQNFPDKRSINALGLITNIRYIVFDSSANENFNPSSFSAKVEGFAGVLKIVAVDRAGYYLLKFLPKTKLDDRFYLRSPSFPGGTINIELMIPYKKDAQKVPITLLETDHYDRRDIGKVFVQPTSSWKTFSIKLPKALNSARPFTIRFTSSGDQEVYLRRRDYMAE